MERIIDMDRTETRPNPIMDKTAVDKPSSVAAFETISPDREVKVEPVQDSICLSSSAKLLSSMPTPHPIAISSATLDVLAEQPQYDDNAQALTPAVRRMTGGKPLAFMMQQEEPQSSYLSESEESDQPFDNTEPSEWDDAQSDLSSKKPARKEEPQSSDSESDFPSEDPEPADQGFVCVRKSNSGLMTDINLEKAMRGTITKVKETLVVTKYVAGKRTEIRRRTRVYDVTFNATFTKK